VLEGSRGDDFLSGGPGPDQIDGADGKDTLLFEGESAPVVADLAAGQATTGGDRDALTSIEHITGGSGDDVLTGDAAANKLSGGGGRDSISGAGGADEIDGGDGDDELNGGDDSDRIDGGNGNDTFDGGPGNDTLVGGSGRSRINGGDGDDSLFLHGPFAPKPGTRLSGGPGRDALWVRGTGTRYDCGSGEKDSLVFSSTDRLPKNFVGATACERVEGESYAPDRYGWCSFGIAPLRMTGRFAAYRLYRDLTPPWQGGLKAHCLGRLYLSARIDGKTVELGVAKPSSRHARVTVRFSAKARAQLAHHRHVVIQARFRPAGDSSGQARWRSQASITR
jgi:hypothetical protein